MLNIYFTDDSPLYLSGYTGVLIRRGPWVSGLAASWAGSPTAVVPTIL